MGEDKYSIIDFANDIRDLIKHENDLTNNRLNWLLTFQSILFGAIALANEKPGSSIHIIVPIVGILTAISIGYTLELSRQARKYLREKWNEIMTEEKIQEFKVKGEPIPLVVGENPFAIRLSWLNSWVFVPWVLVFAWILLLVIKPIIT